MDDADESFDSREDEELLEDVEDELDDGLDDVVVERVMVGGSI